MRQVKKEEEKEEKKEVKKRKPRVKKEEIKEETIKVEEKEDEVEKESSDFSLTEVIIIILISILFGVVIGYMITYGNSPFHRSKHNNLDEIEDVYKSIVDDYYGDLDEDKLASSAIKGMVNSLDDPYSVYLDEDEANEFNESIDGSFVGIGVVVLYDKEFNRVLEVYDGCPAQKAGMQVDDLIIGVDGTDVQGFDGDKISKLIRGEKGTKVKIKVKRGEEELEFILKRDVIKIPSVTHSIYENNIGYIKIKSFSANTYDEFKEALLDLESKEIKSLIIDVRDNLGGQLLQTKQILSLFFNKKTVLYQVESKQKKQKAYSLSKETRSYPVGVLINYASASASEILASCFQENYKNAFIMGEKSVGKGTVQTAKDLSNGTSVKFTTQKWLTSEGKWIHGEGIKPDYEVSQQEAYYYEPTDENDVILKEAINKLKES